MAPVERESKASTTNASEVWTRVVKAVGIFLIVSWPFLAAFLLMGAGVPGQWDVHAWSAYAQILASLAGLAAVVGIVRTLWLQQESLSHAREEFEHEKHRQLSEARPRFFQSTLTLDWVPTNINAGDKPRKTLSVFSYTLSIKNTGGIAQDVRLALIGTGAHPLASRFARGYRGINEIGPGETHVCEPLYTCGTEVDELSGNTQMLLPSGWSHGPLVIEYLDPNAERRRTILHAVYELYGPAVRGQTVTFRMHDDYPVPRAEQEVETDFHAEVSRLRVQFQNRH